MITPCASLFKRVYPLICSHEECHGSGLRLIHPPRQFFLHASRGFLFEKIRLLIVAFGILRLLLGFGTETRLFFLCTWYAIGSFSLLPSRARLWTTARISRSSLRMSRDATQQSRTGERRERLVEKRHCCAYTHHSHLISRDA